MWYNCKRKWIYHLKTIQIAPKKGQGPAMSDITRVQDMNTNDLYTLTLRLDEAGFDSDLIIKVNESNQNKYANRMYASLTMNRAHMRRYRKDL